MMNTISISSPHNPGGAKKPGNPPGLRLHLPLSAGMQMVSRQGLCRTCQVVDRPPASLTFNPDLAAYGWAPPGAGVHLSAKPKDKKHKSEYKLRKVILGSDGTGCQFRRRCRGGGHYSSALPAPCDHARSA